MEYPQSWIYMSNSFTVLARCSAKVVSSSFCKHATVYGILLPAFVQSDRGEAGSLFLLILRDEMLRNVLLRTKTNKQKKHLRISWENCTKTLQHLSEETRKSSFQITRNQYIICWRSKFLVEGNFAEGQVPWLGWWISFSHAFQESKRPNETPTPTLPYSHGMKFFSADKLD